MQTPISSNTINILNHGYISLISTNSSSSDIHTGDLLVVNAARVSFGKWKDVFDESDAKLIEYLVKNKHDSPLRHVQITFRLKAPEFVMRQIYKHIVGITYTENPVNDHAWNEISGRYVEYKDEFYYPDIFRKQSKSNKQATILEEITEVEKARELYNLAVTTAYNSYKELLKLGVGKEIARTILPVSYYTEVIWTASLQAMLNFISLRDHEHAQYETRLYAKAARQLIETVAPITMKAWNEFRSS